MNAATPLTVSGDWNGIRLRAFGKGEHNASNALAVAAAALALGVHESDVAEGLRTFAPLEHRIEPCGSVAGVRCYNDSKATNVDATRFDDGYTLVECHLFTGRTHQIRVHMRHINHACVGDPLYGKCDARADQGLTRQFLHSWRVAFDHPVTGERIECRDELPWDLAAVLDDLAPRSIGRTAAGDDIVPQLGLLEA